MRRGAYEFKTVPEHWRRQPREKGGGRKRLIPQPQRQKLYALLKMKREIDVHISVILEGVGAGKSSYSRKRTDLLRRIWREKGR